MSNELKIEYYLRQLDQYLHALPVGQRAEIITEIKSHIFESLEKTPERGVDLILGDLGTSRTVAERYLLAKGLRPTSPPRGGRVLKWLAIGTVALFAFIFIAGLSTIWYFSPLIHVADDHVTLLGGLIDVNEALGHVKVGNIEIGQAMHDNALNESGDETFDRKLVKLVKIPFNTAKLEIGTSVTDKIEWACETLGGARPSSEVVAGVLNFRLDGLNLGKCKISIPKGLASEFKGINGHMEVRSPQDSMKISLINGKVKIKLDPEATYDFDVKVTNGLKDFFPRSGAKEAVKVKVDVVNGLVKKE